MKFGFIGCGNMGGALISAASKVLSADQIFLCDAFASKAEELAARCGGSAVSAEIIAESCDFIFLGVKPQTFPELFVSIRPVLAKRNNDYVLVSMAAGLSISAVETMAGGDAAIIRIMPNTPASVGAGMILYSRNEKVDDKKLGTFLASLSKAGILDSIPEDKIDAASALSGCGPAFVYIFAEALADGAVECGLPRDKALLYAAQTLQGASKLLLESGKHPGELKDAVCSPGGTTIAGVHALEDGAFRSATMSAVKKAYERTLELKK